MSIGIGIGICVIILFAVIIVSIKTPDDKFYYKSGSPINPAPRPKAPKKIPKVKIYCNCRCGIYYVLYIKKNTL